MSTLPKGIQFKTVKPQGFYQEFRDYTVTPVQTYSNQFSINDIVRVQFNIQDWYIDPYESYIEAEVRLADETVVDFQTAANFQTANKVQFIMMDGPSTSLINDFRIEVNSKEVERIREYDQIGNILTDLNIYPDVVDQKDYEGYYSNRGIKTLQGTQSSIDYAAPSQGSATATTYYYQSNIQSTNILPWTPINTSTSGEAKMVGSSLISPFSVVTNVLTPENLVYGTFDGLSTPVYTGARSYDNNSAIKCLEVTTDARINPSTAPGKFYNYSQFLGQLTAGNTNFGINSADYSHDGGTSGLGYIPNVNSPKLNQIDGHNIFLTNLPTSKIVNGKFQSSIYNQPGNTQCSRAYMQIPLLSGVMGVLIPQERWQLIPSSSLGQVNMEFRFNENAFFSSNSVAPNWIVSKFQLRLRMYRFDAALMAQLKGVVNNGIQLHSQTFSLGPRYTIQANVSPTNNWQLNNGIPSIKQIFFWFLSADYEQYNYCRKNYRLSQNITSMQLKIGSNFIPQNPIIGHAGNIIMNATVQQDNSVFLSELHQAMNLLFDTNRHININKLNFAINERPFDVTLAKMHNIQGANLTTLKKDILLNAGYTMWNELRCKGKALYAFNLEADKKNDNTMSGLDTTKLRPIELILKSDDSNQYPRNSTMFVAFLSDFIVTFNGNDTATEGQG